MDDETWLEQLKLTSLENLRADVPQRLALYQPTEPKEKDKTATFLGALSDFAPTEDGQRNVTIDILACRTDDLLRQLASRYQAGLIGAIRAAGGKTPHVSDHPSRPSADLRDFVNAYLLQPTKCDRRKMCDLVLLRDDYRCILTRNCDMSSVQREKTDVRDDDNAYTILETAHILPFSLLPSSEMTVERSGVIWEVLEAFSGINFEELNGDRIENGIALDSAMHRLFGELALCFEPTENANTYRILHWDIAPALLARLHLPETVTFVSRAGLPVPDPRYLALHAACAKVVHQCGMAEILDKLFKDLEETAVLATDGSSAHMLHHALQIIAVS